MRVVNARRRRRLPRSRGGFRSRRVFPRSSQVSLDCEAATCRSLIDYLFGAYAEPARFRQKPLMKIMTGRCRVPSAHSVPNRQFERRHRQASSRRAWTTGCRA
ncbi:hypothetical protein TSA66_06075 [Noviherbaspirillum autotrophicum]|uniref:Uncharacterized protein n=1 Tax=Noviherbaspirillum autotrophicum TaxID=709839 RepID=A0A0C1Y0D4_9BURK|nr:hypothetical protein TSA66_06075 [Noviherbaspirillum autotrophicum]